LAAVATAETLPVGADKVRAVRDLFDRIAPRYELVNRVMTFGMDRGWRRRCVAALGLTPGSRVLDLACGTGDLCRQLRAGGYEAAGFDLSAGMLAAAHSPAPLVQADALRLPVVDGAADGAVSGFALRNFEALEPFFNELARVVRPGGRIALLDVATPTLAPLRWGHALYFAHVVPRIGAALSDAAAYRYLPKSVAYLPEPPELLARLTAAGFDGVDRRLLSGGITQLITARRSGAARATSAIGAGPARERP
jgi:demethylmenaquinone methyltransferase/2-methoxy-6-polyprenyl-1,4-benzoquinol methylase